MERAYEFVVLLITLVVALVVDLIAPAKLMTPAIVYKTPTMSGGSAENTIIPYNGDLEGLLSIVRACTKQSGRSRLSKLATPTTSDALNNVIDGKLNLPLYDTGVECAINTATFLFEHIGTGIFVSIADNKLQHFLPFENHKYMNNWSRNVTLAGAPTMQAYIYRRQKALRQFKKFNTKMQTWRCNANIINNEVYDPNDNYVPHSIYDYRELIENTLATYSVPDTCFFLNKRDGCLLNKDLRETYPNMYPKDKNGLAPKLPPRFQNKKYAPIISPYTTGSYADVPCIIPEDWKLACKDFYSATEAEDVPWEKKINTAVFRGSGTGSVDIERNQRLQIAKVDAKWAKTQPGLIDAGIVSWNARDKINSKYQITFVDIKAMNAKGIHLKKRIPMNEQLRFKYLINIDGHSATNRFSYLLQSGCLVLNVESKYIIGDTRWYDALLEPYKHYVPVKYDLSDLEAVIEWCRANDEECKAIVRNAKELYDKHFTKDQLMQYTGCLLNRIARR